MPMYWRDFWADTSHLSPLEGWAYLSLIGAYWTNGGPLPNDNDRLQRQARVSAKEWRQIRPTVIAFFAVDDHRIRHRRIDAELAEATKLYDKRKAHIEAVNERRRQKQQQSQSTVTVVNDRPQSSPPVTVSVTATQPQLQPQSPNGETLADASVSPPKPKASKGARLASDWKPSESNRRYAEGLGYWPAEIDAEGGEFRAYFTGPDARQPIKKCWDRAWERWCRENLSRRVSRRARVLKSGQHGSQLGSLVDLSNRVKARAGLGGSGDGGGLGRSGDGVPFAGNDYVHAGNSGASDSAGSTVIDADESERMYRSAYGTEVLDEESPGRAARPGGPAFAVCEETPGLSGGRGEEGPDDPAEHGDLLAGMGGAEGEAGYTLSAAPEASGESDDGYPSDFPDFLKRAPRAL